MPAATRQRSNSGRRLRRAAIRLLAYATIGFAALFAVARLLLPWYLSDAERVEALVSAALQEPVQLGQVALSWDGSHPALSVERLDIGDGELIVERARLLMDPYGLLPSRRLVHELAVDGIAVQLERATDGKILVAGLEGLQTGGDPRRLLRWFDRIAVSGLSLRYADPARQIELDLTSLAAVVDVEGLVLQLGEADAGLRLVVDWDATMNPTRGYLEARAAQLGGAEQTLRFGPTQLQSATLDGQLWLRPQTAAQGLIGELTVSALQFADAGSAAVQGPVLSGVPEALPTIRLRAQARIGANRTLAAGQLTLGDATPSSWSLLADDVSSLLVFETLPVAALARLAGALPASPPQLRGTLAQLNPRGQLGRVEISQLHAHGVPGYRQLRAELAGVDFDSRDGKVPGLLGLRGQLTADAGAVVLDLALRDAELSAPLRFRKPIPIQRAEGRIVLLPQPGGLTVETTQLEVTGPGFAVEGNLQLGFREGERPFLDLLATVPAGDLTSAPYFWVLDVMPPTTVAWLDQALSTGRASGGRWIWRGPVGRGAMPYREYEGQLDASVTLSEMALAFHPDWASGEALTADLRFTDRGLSAQVLDARLAGNPIRGLDVSLADFKSPVLRLQLKNQPADAAPLLQLLRQSPLQQRHGATLDLLAARGPAAVDVELVLPLKRELGAPRYQGEVRLEGVDFRAEAWQLDFAELHGPARFDGTGFTAPALRGRAHDAEVDVSLALGRAHTGSDALFAAEAHGHFAAQALAKAYPGIGRWLGAASGAADFNVGVQVLEPSGAAIHTDVEIRSRLVGVALELPPPLGKRADAAAPFAADLSFRAGQPGSVDVRWGDRLTMQGDLDGGSGLRAAITLGDVPAPPSPAQGVALAAVVDGRDPQAWLALLTGGLTGAAGGGGLASLDLLLTGDAEVGMGDTRIRAGRAAADDSLQLEVSGPQVEGRLSWMPARGERGDALHGDFRKLWLPKPAERGDPGDRGEPGVSEGQGRAGVGSGWSADPRRLPTLHLKVDDFRLGVASLGNTRLETWPTREGLHVDLFEARSSALNLAGDGDWVVLPDGSQQSRFALRFTAEDLGQMLLSLGFAERIEKGQTLAELDGVWPGSPAEFALDRLKGGMRVSVGGGRFVGLEPGAGRLLGLFSIRELPRRLALDFRDFFGEGLSFDRIDGRFELSDGNAWTRDLTVHGPAVEIQVVGRTGLSARDYDQEIVVLPQYGTVLPVVGGLAGGPAGLAAGLLAQGMIAQDEDMGRVHYTVTGSWDTPQIAKLPAVREIFRPRAPEKPPRG